VRDEEGSERAVVGGSYMAFGCTVVQFGVSYDRSTRDLNGNILSFNRAVTAGGAKFHPFLLNKKITCCFVEGNLCWLCSLRDVAK
jgi:hypothetical protein